MSKTYLSLSAIANGNLLNKALYDAVVECQRLNYHGIELAIGARSIPRPDSYIRSLQRGGLEFSAHHAVPLGSGCMLRPEGFNPTLVATLALLGIKRYSMHPPARKLCDGREYWRRTRQYFEAFAEQDIQFSLETMYPLNTASEVKKYGSHRLRSYDMVLRFIDVASSLGWEQPLTFDASHVYIGYQNEMWTAQQVSSVIASGAIAEFHFSANDGKRDEHKILAQHPVQEINDWLALAKAVEVPLLVDEGRRR